MLQMLLKENQISFSDKIYANRKAQFSNRYQATETVIINTTDHN